RGIGLGVAQALAREGFDLVLAGRRGEAEIASTLDDLRRSGVDVLYVAADVGEAEARARLVAATRERFARLNLLVNNAGVAPKVRADLLEAGEESFDRLIRINLKGPYFLTQAVARWMVEDKERDPSFAAAIVNVTSISASVASTDRGDYCLSKAALAMATRLFAVRLGPAGIPVYEVRPGVIRTDMTANVEEKYDRLIANGLLLQPRWGLPEDVGRVVASLARGDLPYSTGAVIMVDGGLTVPRL
ncbi:MAG TPA: 3-ketoacyl-ACP reductase, partial [Vicinamibacteria bacterium]|nr:3-ketoacyl-ACP reductase [Vicinamibacteria bacterium]